MLIGKIKYLEEEGKKHLSSVRSDFIDNDIFKEAIKDTKRMRNIIEERNEITPFFKKLSEDLFHTFHKAQPNVYKKEDVTESLELEHDVLSQLIDNDKIEKLRGNTAGDLFNSTLALNCFQDKAYEIIQEWIEKSKENEDLMDKINDAINKQDTLRDLLEALKDEPDNEDLQKEVEEIQNQVDQANKDINNQEGSSTKSMSAKLDKALKEVQGTVEKTTEALDNFFGGLDGSNAQDGGGAGSGKGVLSKLPFAERLQLAEALQGNSKLKEISNNLGRMKKMLGKLNKKPSRYGNAICDVGIGNILNRILSSEKIYLLDPDLEYHFYKKFLGGSLLLYKTQGEEESRGPIVICLDDSGSMRGFKDCWGKAICIAMLMLAMAQKRSFRCIIFSDGVDAIFDFSKDDYTTEKVIQLAEFFSSGGTSYHGALNEALKSIQESKYNKADVLFITDGDPNGHLKEAFKTRFLSAKKEKEFYVEGMLIGGTNHSYLKDFCDHITEFGDLNKDNELVNIFDTVKD